jgi:hypothetical protein
LKTINISLENEQHQRLSELREQLNLQNLHETVARIIDLTYETHTKKELCQLEK